MKHTPTPWYYDEEKGEVRCEERDYLIANIEPQDITEPEDLFNGEHIVKCVNSHDVLVESLKEIAKGIESSNSSAQFCCDYLSGLAKQALKAAGETV